MAENDLLNSGTDSGNNTHGTHNTDRTDRTGRTDDVEGEHVLVGRELRFVLVNELHKRGTLTVAEMVQLLKRWGFSVDGRASKVISDSLRWERARGRVVRVARGVYAYGRTPPSTLRRIKIFARQCHAWVNAAVQGVELPQTPLTPEYRKTNWACRIEDPYRPPWLSLAWLWTT